MVSNSIAKRYAQALFFFLAKAKGEASSEHQLERLPLLSEIKGASLSKNKVLDNLNSLADLIKSNDDFRALINNPVISIEEKLAVFKAMADQKMIEKDTLNFLSLLLEKGRLSLIPFINAEVKALLLEVENKVEADVTFAAKPSDEVKKDLVKRLETITGKTVVLKESVDKSLIGGVRVKIGSSLYDATIKGQLDELVLALQ